jgi:hypothetical protein
MRGEKREVSFVPWCYSSLPNEGYEGRRREEKGAMHQFQFLLPLLQRQMLRHRRVFPREPNDLRTVEVVRETGVEVAGELLGMRSVLERRKEEREERRERTW